LDLKLDVASYIIITTGFSSVSSSLSSRWEYVSAGIFTYFL